MLIDYVSTYDATNVRNWSGTGTFIARSLEMQGNNINYVGNLEQGYKFSGKIRSALYKVVFGKKFLSDRTYKVAKSFSEQAERKLSFDSKIVFSPGTIPIAYLETDKPKVFYTDATFAGMINYYEILSGLSKESIDDGNSLEQAAFDSCKLCIYSSDWAAETALKFYNVDPQKLKVVPFGANISDGLNASDIETLLNRKSKNICKILFIGVDWFRKGGNFALDIVIKLNETGIKAELHVLGLDKIPVENLPEYVIIHGFISKSSDEGSRKITEIISSVHFLILPSVADCSPIVLPEANSMGIPCITTNVGGIPTIIRNGINGFIFPVNEFVDSTVKQLHNVHGDEKSYKELSLSSFNEYKSRLNWEVAGKTINEFIKQL